MDACACSALSIICMWYPYQVFSGYTFTLPCVVNTKTGVKIMQLFTTGCSANEHSTNTLIESTHITPQISQTEQLVLSNNETLTATYSSVGL